MMRINERKFGMSRRFLLTTLALCLTMTILLLAGAECLRVQGKRLQARHEAARLAAIRRQPLIYAVYRHDLPAVKRLLDSGVSPDTYGDKIGPEEVSETALMLAAEVGDAKIVRLLLDRGALINIVDGWGLTALDYAVDYRHEDVAKILKNRGAKQFPWCLYTGRSRKQTSILNGP